MKSTMAPDMTTMAARVAVVSGSDHCQPMVSCDHMATPKARKTPRAHPSDAKLARACSDGSSALPPRPAADESRHDAVAGHVDRALPRARSLGQVAHQQLGELVAVAGPPALRVPEQQGPGASLGLDGGVRHVSPHAAGQSTQTHVGHAALRIEVGPQRHRPHGRETVRAAAVVARHGLDEPLALRVG